MMLARWNRLSLTARILIGLAVGIAIGVFFGERAQYLQGAADAFIGLLQMTVLPYLFVALVLGLGLLSGCINPPGRVSTCAGACRLQRRARARLRSGCT